MREVPLSGGAGGGLNGDFVTGKRACCVVYLKYELVLILYNE